MEEKRRQKLREEEVRAGRQPAPQRTLEQEQRDRSIRLSWESVLLGQTRGWRTGCEGGGQHDPVLTAGKSNSLPSDTDVLVCLYFNACSCFNHPFSPVIF